MQHRQENRPLHRKLEGSFSEQFLYHRLAAGLTPKPLEDEAGTDSLRVDDGQLTAVMGGQ